MKKFTILAGLMALALFIGVAGTSLRAGTAEARPTDVISFSPDICAGTRRQRQLGSTTTARTIDGDGLWRARQRCLGLQRSGKASMQWLEVLDGAAI